MLVRMDHPRRDSLANLRTVFTTKPITIRSVENYKGNNFERIQRRIFFSKLEIVSYITHRITRQRYFRESKKRKKKVTAIKEVPNPLLFDKNIISVEIEIPNSMKFNFTTSPNGRILQKSFLRKSEKQKINFSLFFFLIKPTKSLNDRARPRDSIVRLSNLSTARFVYVNATRNRARSKVVTAQKQTDKSRDIARRLRPREIPWIE